MQFQYKCITSYGAGHDADGAFLHGRHGLRHVDLTVEPYPVHLVQQHSPHSAPSIAAPEYIITFIMHYIMVEIYLGNINYVH